MANKEKSREADVQPLENPLPEQQEIERPEEIVSEDSEEANPGNGGEEQAGSEQPSPEPDISEPIAPPQPEPDASVKQNENRASIEAWSSRLNIPGWQHAALCRLMGWAAGKIVSEAEYRQGLAVLAGRRMGGGRL